MSDSYAVYRDIVAQAIRADAAISALVDDEIHTSGNTAINDSWLAAANRCCIVVTHQNRNSTGMGGVAVHGISQHDHLMRISVIQDQADSDTYAADVAAKIQSLLEKSITVTMNNIVYQIGFTPPFKTFVTQNSNFPNRIFVIIDIRAQYLG
jgi:hypothetical protein